MRVVASFVILVGILAACGGAAETNLFDEVPGPKSNQTSTTTSGAVSSGASGASGATSGASGTSGAGTSSGNTSSSGVIGPKDAGPPGPRTCTVGDPAGCAPGEYCKSERCGPTGTCAARSDQTPDLNPVCGCDHVTYWNASIAANRGANVASIGACGATGIGCTRNSGCAGEAFCDLEQPLVCAVAEVKGTCWQLPRTCEGTNSRQVRRCNNQQCTTLCLAIADERQFVPGTACP